MPILGKFFPSQKAQEKVFLLLRRHWFTYLGFAAIAFIMSIPVIVLVVMSISNQDLYIGAVGNIIILALFAYLLLTIAVMLYGFIDYYLDVYIVTNERIVNIEQNGFFNREISELHLHQIQDVSAKVDGIFPTMMHYGDIFIQTAGERENFIFKNIPNPYRVSKLIVDLHEAQLEEGGVGRAEENQVMEEYKDENKEKMRDKIDLEAADPAALALARRRTKEFLKGKEAEETDLKIKVQQELTEQHYDKLLDTINNSNKYNSTKLPNPDGKVQKAQTPVKGNNEGEMKENEEVDF